MSIGCEDGVLKDAGVERAAGLVSALQLDQDNLFVSLSARDMNAGLRIVARANAERAAPKLRQAGADVVISPTHIGVKSLLVAGHWQTRWKFQSKIMVAA